MQYLGIDPGATGAIAVVCDDMWDVWKMPDTPADLFSLLEGLMRIGPCFALVERIVGAPRGKSTGNRKIGVQSSWQFGFNVGTLYGVLAGCRIPHELILPQQWQKAMNCRTGGDKRVSKAAAQRLFPETKVTLWNADAILLAELCRRRIRGTA